MTITGDWAVTFSTALHRNVLVLAMLTASHIESCEQAIQVFSLVPCFFLLGSKAFVKPVGSGGRRNCRVSCM